MSYTSYCILHNYETLYHRVRNASCNIITSLIVLFMKLIETKRILVFLINLFNCFELEVHNEKVNLCFNHFPNWFADFQCLC